MVSVLVGEGDACNLPAILIVSADLTSVGARWDLLVGDQGGDGLGVRASLDRAGVGDGTDALADVLLLVDHANLAHNRLQVHFQGDLSASDVHVESSSSSNGDVLAHDRGIGTHVQLGDLEVISGGTTVLEILGECHSTHNAQGQDAHHQETQRRHEEG